MLAMAAQIIARRRAAFAPDEFEDRYEEALLTLVKSKIAGGQPVITKAPERGNVVNLMDALRRCIEEERRPPAPSLGKAAAPPPRRPRRRPPRRPRLPQSPPQPQPRRRKPPDADGPAWPLGSALRQVLEPARATELQRRRRKAPAAHVARDLTRRSDVLVVGALATRADRQRRAATAPRGRKGARRAACSASAPSPPRWTASRPSRRPLPLVDRAGRNGADAATTPSCWPRST